MRSFDDLIAVLEGDLYLDPFRRRLLATDGSIFQEIPCAVAYPSHPQDVVEIVKFARVHNFPVHARGTGSGVCGSALGPGIVVDFSKYMNRLISLDLEGRYFECEPGFRMGELAEALKGTGLFFPPDPSSGEYASFGGMYATNASGAHSVKYGNVGDYVLDAQIITANGQVFTLSELRSLEDRDLPRQFKDLYNLYQANADRIETAYPPVRYNSTGYNLRSMVDTKGRLDLSRLFSGAEGTLGMVTRLKFRLLEKNKFDILIVAYFKDIVSSARATQDVLPLNPCGIEIMDKSLLSLARQRDENLDRILPPDIDNLLLIAFDEPLEDLCLKKADKVEAILRDNHYSDEIHIAFSEKEKADFWSIRKAAVPILYKMKGEKKVLALIEDAVVPTRNLVPYFEGIYTILEELDVRFVLFGHISKGLLHTRPMLNLKTREDTALLKTVSDRIFDLVRSLEGAISGEHGDGRLRSVYISRQYPDIFHLFQRVKTILDPRSMFNPDILTGASPDPGPERPDTGPHRFACLRYGPEYRAVSPFENHLFKPGLLVREIEKCHGCSKCTTVTHATRMCPVYKVTRDEAASPKAKANVLFSLISGGFEPLEAHAFARGISHVLDHCISCGSCSHECPSGVDIPKMVMEVRVGFKKRFGTSLFDRLVTSAEQGARLSRPFAGIMTPLINNKTLRKMGENFLGISCRRRLDAFAKKDLRQRIPLISGGARASVLYFAGCYASYIRPEIGQAAVRVLRALDMKVVFPNHHCCGLPMVSKGMGEKGLDAVRANLDLWKHLVRSSDYIVFTCSSCLLSLTEYWLWFMDAGRIRPGSQKAHAVKAIAKKAVHMSSLVNDHIKELDITPSNLSVAYHTPCHLKAGPHGSSSVRLLQSIPGLALDNMECHCCGMAGTWGMKAAHYELSNRIGSDLKTCLESSFAGTGATDCPTCRMQMASFSQKPVLHPVEILSRHLK